MPIAPQRVGRAEKEDEREQVTLQLLYGYLTLIQQIAREDVVTDDEYQQRGQPTRESTYPVVEGVDKRCDSLESMQVHSPLRICERCLAL